MALVLQMRKVFISVFFFGQSIFASEFAELDRLVDCPTAGLLGKGRYAVGLRLFEDGGVLTKVQAGALKRLTIGLSFGARHLIGRGTIDWQPRAEVEARYRAVEESEEFPAIVLGYESQGYGSYVSGNYENRPKGFFGVLSKNYMSGFGQFGLHAGLSFSSVENYESEPSGWFGLDKGLNEDLSAVFEYEIPIDDLVSGAGIVNIGLNWVLSSVLHIRIFGKDMLLHDGLHSEPSRELAVVYTENF